MKLKEIANISLLALSAYLMLSGATSAIASLILVVSSIMLMVSSPIMLIPLIFLSSISSTFVAIPFIAGYFYYSYLFIIGCLMSNRGMTNSGISVAIVVTILYVIWLFISSVYSISGEMQQTIRMSVGILPIFIVSLFKQDVVELPKYMFVMAVSISIYTLLKLLISPEVYIATIDDSISYGNMLNAQLTISANINPNTLSQAMLLSYLIIYTYAINTKKILLLIFAILPIIPMLLIGSRTAFISLLIISIVTLLINRQYSKKTKTLVLMCIICLAPIILEKTTAVNERLDVDSIVEDDGSGRFDTWRMLMANVVPNNPIMGVGYGRENLERLGYVVDADNMYVDALSQIGAVGLCLIVLMLLLYIKPLWQKQDTNSRIAVSLLLFIPIVGFGETVFDTFIFVFILFYAILAKEGSVLHKSRL